MFSRAVRFVHFCRGHYGGHSCDIMNLDQWSGGESVYGRRMMGAGQRPLTIAHLEPL